LKLSIAFGVCAGSFEALAQKSTGSRKKVGWVRASVVTDGAAVYKAPDFDSAVQEYLRYQTPVMASKKAYVGVGGLGLFHKVQFKGGSGFVADTDIRVTKKADKEEAETTSPQKSASKAWEKEEEENLGKAPLYFTRYLGMAVSGIKFTEKFSGQKLSDNMLMYGLRMSGPGTLFDGPPLDFNFLFSLQKPGYYKKFASGDPNGFMLFGDVMVQLPMYDRGNSLVTYGLGVMWTFTKYTIPVRGVPFDSQELRVGFDAGFGYGYRIGKRMIRADAKYYHEKTQYFGATVSFQTEY
jgi:hypothetical protein